MLLPLVQVEQSHLYTPNTNEHTLSQNLLFVATSVVNNFERAKLNTKGGTGSHVWVLTENIWTFSTKTPISGPESRHL